MALEPPKAKKEVYWNRMEVVVISTRDKEVVKFWKRIRARRKRGMLVARDWVMQMMVMISWMRRAGFVS